MWPNFDWDAFHTLSGHFSYLYHSPPLISTLSLRVTLLNKDYIYVMIVIVGLAREVRSHHLVTHVMVKQGGLLNPLLLPRSKGTSYMVMVIVQVLMMVVKVLMILVWAHGWGCNTPNVKKLLSPKNHGNYKRWILTCINYVLSNNSEHFSGKICIWINK